MHKGEEEIERDSNEQTDIDWKRERKGKRGDGNGQAETERKKERKKERKIVVASLINTRKREIGAEETYQNEKT